MTFKHSQHIIAILRPSAMSVSDPKSSKATRGERLYHNIVRKPLQPQSLGERILRPLQKGRQANPKVDEGLPISIETDKQALSTTRENCVDTKQ